MAAPKKEIAVAEPEYTVEEFAAGAGTIFDEAVSPDIVTAALRVAGVKKTTKSEAKKIIDKFKTKEVN
jgi:hypothetical protein